MARLTALALTVAILATAGAQAHAAFPGSNGLIAYVSPARPGQIWVIGPGGDGKRKLVDGVEPAWSPDGTRIAFNRGNEIFVANADGSGARRITEGVSPSWSPDGRRLVYAARFDPVRAWDIHVVDLATGATRALTDTPAADGRPEWSPDGTRIAFLREGHVWVMGADGSGQRILVAGPGANYVDWSPDGTRIAFERNGAIFAASADGSGAVRLSTERVFASAPAWSPDGRRIAWDAFGDLCVAGRDGADARRLTYDAPGQVYAPGGPSIDWQPTAGPGLGGEAPYSCEERQWDLAASIAIDRPSAKVGDVLEYDVAVRNVGPQPVFRVHGSVSVRVSDLAEAVHAETSRGDCRERIRPNTFHCRLETIFPGETITIAVTARVVEPGLVVSEAALPLQSFPGDFNPANDRAAAATRVGGCTIVGTEDDDTIRGTPRRDVICAGSGDDRILAASGHDVVYAQAGDDDVSAEAGVDWVDGGRGRDVVRGGPGADLLWGGDGNDLVEGGDGNDRVRGGMTGGRAIGGAPYWDERDRVRGGPGHDVVDGGVGWDGMRGDAGRDLLLARDGYKEAPNCGPGRDRLVADTRDLPRGCEAVSRAEVRLE